MGPGFQAWAMYVGLRGVICVCVGPGKRLSGSRVHALCCYKYLGSELRSEGYMVI